MKFDRDQIFNKGMTKVWPTEINLYPPTPPKNNPSLYLVVFLVIAKAVTVVVVGYLCRWM